MPDASVKEELLKKALEAREAAYSPYSCFTVGAAVLTEDGRIYTGCNIENASFGATICAERTAIFKAVSDGVRTISAIAIAGGKGGEKALPVCQPCGICRQVMAEFAYDDDFPVILGNEEGITEEYPLGALMPHRFDAL